MKGELTRYRYDLVCEMTPQERDHLIQIVRQGIKANTFPNAVNRDAVHTANTFLGVLGVGPEQSQ